MQSKSEVELQSTRRIAIRYTVKAQKLKIPTVQVSVMTLLRFLWKDGYAPFYNGRMYCACANNSCARQLILQRLRIYIYTRQASISL